MLDYLKKAAKNNGIRDLNPAILRTPELSAQKSLWLKIASGLSIYFIQNMKKSLNRSKAWKECIR
ncbi:MAG: hypothetical protein PVG67_17255 [Desulfobacterales bacterium]|jgi:hypothetical protein